VQVNIILKRGYRGEVLNNEDTDGKFYPRVLSQVGNPFDAL